MEMLIKEHAVCPHIACLLLLATSLIHSQLSPWREKALVSSGCRQPPTHTQQCCLFKYEAKFGFSFFSSFYFLEKFTLKSTSLPDIHICFIIIEVQGILIEVMVYDTEGWPGFVGIAAAEAYVLKMCSVWPKNCLAWNLNILVKMIKGTFPVVYK